MNLKLRSKLPFQKLLSSPNVAEHLHQEDLEKLGRAAVQGYELDLRSRREWEERNSKAIELALQVQQTKTFPWTGASNVKFPLVTIAALQFLARVSILTKGRNLVRVEPWGADPSGRRSKQAQRISAHMSYQLLEEDRTWLDEDEIAKFSASILGCAIKKTYHDPVQGINRSTFVPLMNFVVDYRCRDLSTAVRATEVVFRTANDLHEMEERGLFLQMLDDTPARPGQQPTPLRTAADDANGMREQADEPSPSYELLEQHCWLDLDGDGYAEPYVMTVRKDTEQVLRIAARFFDSRDVYRTSDKEINSLKAQMSEVGDDLVAQSRLELQMEELEKKARILRIVPAENFTRYTFIPSPDGGFYGLGLGALLGPTNASVDTIINQLVDSGTMQNTAGGFLGRGVKIKSGKLSFDPFEWKTVDSVGDDLRKNIVPLPVNAPSEVLFKLLGLLIQYGEKIGSATDIMTGIAPGQNTPAETSRNTLEQGMMLFSGIYTRMHRAFREELHKLYHLNRLYLEQSATFAELTQGEAAMLAADDYTGSFRVTPAADAAATSSAQKQARAAMVYQLAVSNPTGFDLYLVKKRMLEAHDVEDVELLLPDPQGPKAIAPPPNPKVEIEKAKLQQAAKEHEDGMQLAVAELQSQIAVNNAKEIELLAKAEKARAEASGVETGHQIALIEAQLGAQKAHKEHLQRVLDTLLRAHTANKTKAGEAAAKVGVETGAVNAAKPATTTPAQ